MRVQRWPGRHRDAATLLGAVATLLTCWMLLMPPGSQPDEHSHLVRSAALVRGSDDEGSHLVPDRYRVADPGCYAFDPFQPATCAPVPVHVDGDTRMITRADDYPPGGHLLFGLAGLLPGLDPVWWARGAAVVLATLLFGGALVCAVRRRRALGAAVLVAATPTAWSTMTAANPSALAISGAIALWIGLVTLDSGNRPVVRHATSGWLVVGGWTALATSRRDGLVWACLIVAFVVVLHGRRVVPTVRHLGVAGTAVVLVSSTVTVAWGLGSGSSTSRLVVLAPAALAAPALLDRAKRRITTLAGRPVPIAIVAAAAAGLIAVSWFTLVANRRGGWSTTMLLTVVEQTDDNLIEAIGLLGWLDTPVPAPVVFAWLMAIGALVAVGVADRTWVPAAALVGLVVTTAWTFELLQGNASGTYWQGRYSLPLLVGLPIVLVDRCRSESAERIASALTVAALASVHVAVWAAGRRFGVGVAGSRFPWQWDTPLQPVPPVALVVASALAAAVLAVTVVRAHR